MASDQLEYCGNCSNYSECRAKIANGTFNGCRETKGEQA